jgi:ribonuclease HI
VEGLQFCPIQFVFQRIELEWTPGHVEVQGNEIADRLPNEAAKEAQEQDTTVHTMVTKQDM